MLGVADVRCDCVCVSIPITLRHCEKKPFRFRPRPFWVWPVMQVMIITWLSQLSQTFFLNLLLFHNSQKCLRFVSVSRHALFSDAQRAKLCTLIGHLLPNTYNYLFISILKGKIPPSPLPLPPPHLSHSLNTELLTKCITPSNSIYIRNAHNTSESARCARTASGKKRDGTLLHE